MFHLRRIAAELRRRRGRTLLTSLGLAVDDDSTGGRQSGAFGRLSGHEQRELRRENEEHNQQFNFAELGEPG